MKPHPATQRVFGPAGPAFLDTAHQALARLRRATPATTPEDTMAFELAVIEIVGNAIEHAKPIPGPGPVRLVLDLEATENRLLARLHEHEALQPNLPHRVAPLPDEQAESGRGLTIAHRLLTGLTLDRAGHTNTWTLTLETKTTRTQA